MNIHPNEFYFSIDPGFHDSPILLRLPEVQNGNEILTTPVVKCKGGRYTVHLHYYEAISEDADAKRDIGYLTARGLELVRPHDHESCSVKYQAFAAECFIHQGE